MAVRNKVEKYRDRYTDTVHRYRDSPADAITENMYGILAVITTVFATWIRLIPENGMEYLQALDTYMISRYAEAIVSNGYLPMNDVWRYVPYITPTWHMNLGNIYIPAYAYSIIEPVTALSFLEWAQIYPAIAGGLMALVMYFIGKEMFDKTTGVCAAFFLAASPAILHRSSAGWFEKEPIAALLMFISIYFLVRAWKRKDWLSGIVSGTALGVAATAWGGTQFLFLLYPITAFIVVFLNEDIENLLIAFTPTLLIGHVLPATLNPARSQLPNPYLLAALGVLTLIWLRYSVEEYDLLNAAYYRYVVPATTIVGAVLMFLSPLYSQRLASMVEGLMEVALQSGGDVIAGTVAENTPASVSQIIGQLGVARIQNIQQLSGFYPVAEFFSGWTFAILGTTALITIGGYMLLRKYDIVDTVSAGVAYFAFILVTLVFSGIMISLLLPENASQQVKLNTFLAFAYPMIWAFMGGIFLFLFAPKQELSMENKWYIVLPLLWILATLFGATQRSRLLFLTSQPVALMAGFGLATVIRQLRTVSVWEMMADRMDDAEAEIDARRLFIAVLVLVLIPVVVFNAGAAQSMASQIGGSPNGAWMENLDYMREETPVDSVILSWWDYGYHFETIGGRAAIADGGNLGFYGEGVADGHKINLPLADFLTSEDHTDHMDWLQQLSVDYVVLDASMIGKYSAVSQIANRDNSDFSAMQTFDCRERNGQCTVQRANGNQYLTYCQQRNNRCVGPQFLVPIEQNENGGASPAGTPLFRQQGASAPIENFCSPDGIMSFDTNSSQQSLPGCVAFHPYSQHQQLVYIPEDVMDSTLVRLYVMDAYQMPAFDEVQNNGYVKMWEVDYPEDTQ